MTPEQPRLAPVTGRTLPSSKLFVYFDRRTGDDSNKRLSMDLSSKVRAQMAAIIAARPSYWLTGLAYVLCYVSLDRLSYLHPFGNFGITAWNPETGLSVALILILGRAYVPWLFLAPLLGDIVVRGMPLSVHTTLFHTALSGAAYGYSATRLATEPRQLALGINTRNDLFAFVTQTALSALVVSFIYVSVLTFIEGLIEPDQAWRAIRRYWVGDMIGIMVLTPFLMALYHGRRVFPRGLEAIVMLALMCGALAIVFGFSESAQFQLFYLVFLPLIWIAVRNGVHPVTGSLLVTQCLLIAAIQWSGQGAIEVTSFQILMLILALTGLTVGVLVTEQQDMQRALLLHREALGRAARASNMGEFAATLAHEINQPLTAIGSYLGVVRRLLANPSNDTVGASEAARQASAQVERAANVIRRLREFISTGRSVKAAASPRDLIERIYSFYRADLAQSGIVLKRIVADGLPNVLVDGIQIEQVVINLVRNAAEAIAGISREDGQVRIEAALESRDRVRISVIDNGPGFDPSILQQPITAFTSTKADGMGLGLALSRSIVEEHGGKLSIESNRSGSRVSITLPVAT